jgi:hypothetical protein
MPEVDALYAAGSRARRSKVNPGAHLSLALAHAAKRGFTLSVRYAVLAHDFVESALRPRDGAPSAQAMRNVRRAEAMSARLKVPAECRDAARLMARWHRIVVRAPTLQPAVLLGVINAADALRRPERLEMLLHACECVVTSAPNAPDDFAPARYMTAALAVAKGVAAGPRVVVGDLDVAGAGHRLAVEQELREVLRPLVEQLLAVNVQPALEVTIDRAECLDHALLARVRAQKLDRPVELVQVPRDRRLGAHERVVALAFCEELSHILSTS